MKFYCGLLLCFCATYLPAQQLQWQKLNTEPYPGKQYGYAIGVNVFKLQKSPE